ncbi:NRAMP-like transporter smf-1 [Caenorhabditis elegans]|uniref:NRAMP-like transporter smf-1 n=1 Tax=Caenorhabditis elegans TaxID=6239 RepID=NRAMA_CAEEL|nr:NRAMP-like transporter smf-1 [Caenorhabditis elegans]Q21434.2 RecName: Full=NRAMP-like transporter smf-1; AltName: Full=Divalent metal transporter smf-1 [Caenorhabditis elegans]CCD70800.1 NRAMP-like transporter smf-1 [Caenorhabditis elegans]|eukprot:NP_001024792.2 NRAMP-like transporter smf-1 [Caenorhabditis elegans]
MASSNNDGPIEPEAEPWRITQNDHLEQDLLEEDAESQERVDIPVDDVEKAFSFKKLWAFTGPGFLMSIAYLDPGNIESDLQSGAQAAYKLLWVLLSAHIIGMLLQRMSARLGVVSGKHMAEVAYQFYPRLPRIILWLMIEIAIVCSDMQEVIGTAIAIFLLSKGFVPLYVGVFITILDTFTFLLIDRYGIRKLELIFGFLILTMTVSFGYEFVVVKPPIGEVISGMVVPWCAGCGKGEFMQAISVVGAVIMPHNLYLHSALVKSRRVDRKDRRRVAEANKYFTLESAIALFLSFFINLFVVAVFAHGLYQKTNADVREMCIARHDIPDADIFPNNTEPVEVDIYKGGIYLGCQFGAIAMFIWGIGIFAAGQSSTMTGTYTGQFVMEGFVKIEWPKWKRVLITRAIAITPTLVLTFYSQGVQNLTGMNDFLNCVQMIQLPFALIPIITFTSSRKIMHDFRSSKVFQIFALITSALILSINVYFISDYVFSRLGSEWYIIMVLAPITFAYVLFVLYLALYCLVSCEIIPDTVSIRGFSFNKSYENDAPWLAVDSSAVHDNAGYQ